MPLTLAQIKKLNEMCPAAQAIGLGTEIATGASGDIAHYVQRGSVALGGKTVTWVGLNAAVSAYVVGTVDCSTSKNVEGLTIIASGDGGAAETCTFTAGTQGYNRSGSALDIGRFIIIAGVNDTIPTVTETGGGTSAVNVLTGNGAILVTNQVYTGTQLAAGIAAALTGNATLVGIYGCDYSATTGLFTVSATGITSFAIPWATGGGNKISATIGFTADKSAALTYTSDVEVRVNVLSTYDDLFTISVNGGAGVSCTVAAGNYTLAACQTAIATALTNGGVTGVTMSVASSKMVFTSNQKGSGSIIALSNGLKDFLRIIACQSGTQDRSDGTGWAVNTASATLAEMVARLNTLTNVAAQVHETKYIRLKSKTTGATSTVAMGNGTANATLGFTNLDDASGSASQGLNPMADGTYYVHMVPQRIAGGGTSPGNVELDYAAAGFFGIRPEIKASTVTVRFLVVGEK